MPRWVTTGIAIITRSSPAMPRARAICSARAPIRRWLNTTTFGWPVVPELVAYRAGASTSTATGSTGAGVASSAAVAGVFTIVPTPSSRSCASSTMTCASDSLRARCRRIGFGSDGGIAICGMPSMSSATLVTRLARSSAIDTATGSAVRQPACASQAARCRARRTRSGYPISRPGIAIAGWATDCACESSRAANSVDIGVCVTPTPR